jgi:sugar phosphate isomerase/epimerase
MVVAMRSRTDQPSIEQWAEQIECAKLLKAGIVAELQSLRVAHGGKCNGYEFAAEVINIAEENDVILCVETGPLPTLKKLGDKFDSLRYCLDTGYINTDTHFGFKCYVDELGERITHLHLNDNCGLADDHEPPGTSDGISRENWDYLLETLNRYDNDIIGSFEMCPCTPGVMLRQASDFVFDVLKWPNRPLQQSSSVQPFYRPP